MKPFQFLKFLRILLLSVILFGVSFVFYTNLAAKQAGEGVLYDEVAQVPSQAVGLVFGTTNKIGNRENLYFTYRIDAAVELWNTGKVQCLVVSGDNRERFYNEPDRMREALIERGIPKDKIVRDFAGLSTFDSVVRAKKVFQVPSVIFISQKFQNERAAYIARANDMKHAGYNARDVKARSGLRTRVREVAARVKMWLDVNILETKPTHLGPKESLPISSNDSSSRVVR